VKELTSTGVDPERRASRGGRTRVVVVVVATALGAGAVRVAATVVGRGSAGAASTEAFAGTGAGPGMGRETRGRSSDGMRGEEPPLGGRPVVGSELLRTNALPLA